VNSWIQRRWRNEPKISERLPVDVFPCSNGEFDPGPVTLQQQQVMALAEDATEQARRRFGMTRREFVRTAAAYTIGFWAIDQVMGTQWGSYTASAHNTNTWSACDLEWPHAQLNNLPGEFIFDVQSHHVDPHGKWRVTNPAIEAFFAAVWPQAGGVAGASTPDKHWPNDTPFRGGREIDPIENLSKFHYLKELFLDSSTNFTVLSAVPSSPDNNPLPVDLAADTINTVKELAGGTPRSVMHAFVMPNRGSFGTGSSAVGVKPVYMQEEFDLMRENKRLHGDRIRGWKVYTAWGDVPYQSGWFLDDDIGMAFLEQVKKVGDEFNMPKLIAVHKGFALTGFDQRAASPRDVGPAARNNPEVTIVAYHSGYDGETVGPYPGDDKVNSADRSVDSFIKSLRENGLDAERHIQPGLAHGNCPNVYAEIGSTWRSVMRDPNQAAHLMGKLIQHVGPQRICWGTDSLWFGSPQAEIIAFRALQMSDKAKALYNLPFGLDGDAADPRVNALSGASYARRHPAIADWPTDHRSHPERSIRNAVFGRNAARIYRVDADAQLNKIKCDKVNEIHDAYIVAPGTSRERAPLRANASYGRRTRREVLKDIFSGPWHP
jgi:predicted TIM-barrel fold metal-dependent hydrolase